MYILPLVAVVKNLTLIFFIQSAAFTQSLMVNTHHTNGLNACFMILLFFFILYG